MKLIHQAVGNRLQIWRNELPVRGSDTWTDARLVGIVRTMTAIAQLSLVALDCPDPLALARFYSALTGWAIENDESGW